MYLMVGLQCRESCQLCLSVFVCLAKHTECILALRSSTCSCNRPQLHGDPDEDKAVTKNE